LALLDQKKRNTDKIGLRTTRLEDQES